MLRTDGVLLGKYDIIKKKKKNLLLVELSDRGPTFCEKCIDF